MKSNQTIVLAMFLFCCATSGQAQQRDYFTENFTGADNDLDNATITFTPNGSTNYYSVCREPATAFPTTGGTNLTIQDHSFIRVALPQGVNVSLYGISTNAVHVGAGGYISFAAESLYEPSLTSHFAAPKISGLLTHLHPSQGGKVLFLTLSNRIAVTFSNVLDYNTSTLNNFQMEMFFDGRIRMTHLNIGSGYGLCGLSRGTGLPNDFLESNLSSYGPCALPMTVTVPEVAGEGQTLTGQVNVASAPLTNLLIDLSSSLAKVVVPPSVTVAVGQTAAVFKITVASNDVLDGVQSATIQASAPGYHLAADTIQVNDDESADLFLSIPADLSEANGTVGATVMSSAAPTADIRVSMASSDTTELQVPSFVTLPAGATSAVFLVTVVNDNQIDGSQPVSISASVPNWSGAVANTVVHDNETTNLVIKLPASVREGSGVVSGGSVRISGTLSTNVAVSLLSGDLSEVTVPSTITILAGQTNANFSLTVINDTELDGPQTVSISADASGFVSGSTNLVVLDDESPLPPSSPSPAHLATNILQTADLFWSSGAVSGEVITNDVYFGTNPVPGETELVGTTTNSAWILSNLWPQTTYYWKIVARKAGSTEGPVWQFTTRGVDHFVWDTVPSPQFVSEPFQVRVTGKDVFGTTVTNFSGPVNISGHIGWVPRTGNILTNTAAGLTGTAGPYTLGYSFTPNTNLTVTHVRSYFGTKVSIWTSNGVLLASQNVASVNGTWTETPLSNPVLLTAGTTYRVAAYTGAGSYYYQTQSSSVFADGVINQTFVAPGDVFPTQLGQTRYYVDLRYTVNDGQSALVTPTVTGAFTNGVWSGNVTALAPATNMILAANGGLNRTGVSNPFVVDLRNDIAVSVSDSPDPVAVGGSVTYTITVTNIGPDNASGVVVTNFLPQGFAFVSVTPANRSSVVSNHVVCNLQALLSRSSETVSIVATATNVGTFTNRTVVSRSDADSYLSNNTVSVATSVVLPMLSVNDVSAYEANSGAPELVLTVRLVPPPALPVNVSFSTTNGTAQANADYIPTNGVLTFAPGETNKVISIPIIGDLIFETNESFNVVLSSPTNAGIADGSALVTIFNDDSQPKLSISDVTLAEGNGGTTNAIFDISLSGPSSYDITASFTTANGSALSAVDYAAKSGSIRIPAGSTSTNITVVVNGDRQVESDEVFYVTLSSVTNAILVKREGYGLIINDDGLPGNVDRFVWSAIAPTQFVASPFNVTITALDAFNNVATNFNSTVALSTSSPTKTNNVLGNVVHTSSSSGAYTLGYSFTPTTNLTVTHVRSYFGTKVSIWTSTGTLVAAQTVAATSGAWSETALPQPVTLTAGATYRIAAYTGGGFYYYRQDLGGVFTNGVINQSYQGSGDVFPTTTDSVRWWLVDFRYHVGSGSGVPMTPEISGSFTNGVWSGAVTLLAPTTNTALQASDNDGSFGISAPIAVLLRDDISVKVDDTPDPVVVEGELTYSIAVTNIGPSAATGVVLTNIIPAGARLVAVTPSQGSYTNFGETVVCHLGTIHGTNEARVMIVVAPVATGTITNVTTVSRGEADTYQLNNQVTVVSTVVVPSISVLDANVNEGSGVSTNLNFNVRLSRAGAQTISVNFTTSNGSALSDSDYLGANGTVVFTPGETNKVVSVLVNSDGLDEATETVFLTLFSPTNATLLDSQAIGTIFDSDPMPVLSVSNTSVVEGDAGRTNAVFSLSLSSASGLNVTVSYSTAAGTAVFPLDYTSTNGSLVFGPGETNKTISVAVNGDTLNELDETFLLNLNATGATYTNGQRTCTIVNDDLLPTILLARSVLVGETCGPTNGAVDPGETVTLSITLTNGGTGGAVASNLTATLLATNGVSSPSGIQNFGQMAPGGPSVTQPFTFTAIGECGDLITATFQLQDGGENLGIVTLPVTLGRAQTDLFENFDGVIAPSLPVGWTTTTGLASWSTTSQTRDTAPNAAFCPAPGSNSANALTSPAFQVKSTDTQLSFRHSYNTEQCCDRCYLQISINGGSFQEFVAAGGSFVTNGYSNSVGWGGNSLGFITTVAKLPAAAVGQSVRLRWYLTTDGSVSGPGWYVDSIEITGGSYTCCQGNDLALSMSDSPDPVVAGSQLTYSLFVTNYGPAPATGVIVSNFLPAGISFVSANSSQGNCIVTGGTVACDIGTLAGSAGATVSIVVTPNSLGSITNRATVSRAEADPIASNNLATNVTTVVAPQPPAIVSQPFSQTRRVGSSASFSVTATGSAPLRYQWRKNGVNLFGNTNSTLTLTNVQLSDAGNYSVAVTNAYGSVLSSNAVLTVSTNFVRVGVGPVSNSAEWNAMTLTLTNLGFEVVTVAQGQWSGADVILACPASASSFGPSRTEVSAGLGVVQISDIGSDWTANSWQSVAEGSTVLVSLDTTHAITAGLPTSWNSQGFWRYGYSTEDFVGYSTETALLSLATVRFGQSNQARALVASSVGDGRGVYIGWNVYGPSANSNDVALLRNALMWASGNLVTGTPPTIVSSPQSRAAVVGSSVSFSVVANGTQPLRYQWRKGNAALQNQTNATLTFANVQTNDAGSYSVVVTNAYGSATSAAASLVVTANTGDVLLIWDQINPRMQALHDALVNNGLNVVLSVTSETNYNGANPSPAGFDAVIHLNGTTFNTDMPLEGQAALTNFVHSGGAYVSSEWNSYEWSHNRMFLMRDLILFDRRGGTSDTITLSALPEHAGHAMLSNIASNFTLTANYNIGSVHQFATNPAVVLMRQGTNDAVAVRQFGSGRVVNFHIAANYDNSLLDTNLQQLYINAVRWGASGSGQTNTQPLVFSSAQVTADGLQLTLGSSGDASITQERLAKIRLYATTNLFVPWSNWVQLTNMMILTNGAVRFEGLNHTNSNRQFYRAIEIP